MTKEDKASSESLRLILVVFLGGCTFSEISALRFLGREKGKRDQEGGSGGQRVVLRRLLDGSLGTTCCGLAAGSGAGSPVPPSAACHCHAQERGTVSSCAGPARVVELEG